MASYQHEWQCIYCRKQIRRVSSNPNPPTPFVGGYCPSNPFGNKKSKCVLQKIK
ncbi:MAG: hypothetical protein J1E81_01585 [Eubacterium sp.]|nr:hypothetical protein [Eubacterium sp.]